MKKGFFIQTQGKGDPKIGGTEGGKLQRFIAVRVPGAQKKGVLRARQAGFEDILGK